MKKTTRVLVALLALTLVTSCFVGGTFAKYVTDATDASSARVAKFGVTVAADVDPFLASYDATATALDKNGDAIAKTVVAYNGTDLLVAPGTSGDLGSTSITGTPEVAVNVKKVATLTLDNWVVDGAEYCPIVITVNGTKYEQTGTIEDFIADVEAAIETDVNYAPNTVLDATDDVAITWEWAFEPGDGAANQTNALDTALGNQAATSTAATIGLEITTTVTQID